MDIKVIASSSSGNCYLISDGKTNILIECGISIKTIQIALEFNLSRVAGCFISHCHNDHSKAARDLAKMGVDIYTSQGTIGACSLTGHRIHPIKALEELTVGTFKVLPFGIEHDVPEPLGFLFETVYLKEKLLFFSDTYYLRYRFNKLNYIMAECNYSNEALQRSVDAGYIPIELVPRLMKSHMSLEHLLDLLRANDLSHVKQIYLLHLSKNNSNEKHFKKEVQRLTGTEVYVC